MRRLTSSPLPNCRYNIVFTLVTYVVPMLQMLVSYSHMGIVLWSKDQTSHVDKEASVPVRRDSYVAQQRERAIMSKRKVRLGKRGEGGGWV